MKKNRTLLMILGLLLVVVMGVSFAYFTIGVTISGSGGDTDLGTGEFMKVQYDAGTGKLVVEDLMPKGILSKGFKVIVTPTDNQKEVTYRIFIDVTNNTFVKCSEDNFDEITNNCELGADELIYRIKDSNGNVLASGDLTGKTGVVELIRENKTQDVRTEYEYNIEIEFKDTNKDQNHNANKTFNGEVKVEFANNYLTINDIVASVSPKDTTPDFSQVATTDEGVYAVEDGMYGGTSYYWRGAVTNNYVKFGGFCWRIVRINGDGSMRLIYDGTTCHANGTTGEEAVTSQAYNASRDRSEYVGWTYEEGKQRPDNNLTGTSSNLKIQNETWYNSNLASYAERIADGKYCNDRNTASGSSWSSQPSSTFSYAARERLYTNKTPTLACNSGDVYTLKVGAITADEVAYAGGVYGTDNRSYYLYNRQYYWTMSPYTATSFPDAVVFAFAIGGSLDAPSVRNATPGVRPVINLKADTLFQVGGNGTLENPYESL